MYIYYFRFFFTSRKVTHTQVGIRKMGPSIEDFEAGCGEEKVNNSRNVCIYILSVR